jgi:hypothetical protein
MFFQPNIRKQITYNKQRSFHNIHKKKMGEGVDMVRLFALPSGPFIDINNCILWILSLSLNIKRILTFSNIR